MFVFHKNRPKGQGHLKVKVTWRSRSNIFVFYKCACDLCVMGMVCLRLKGILVLYNKPNIMILFPFENSIFVSGLLVLQEINIKHKNKFVFLHNDIFCILIPLLVFYILVKWYLRVNSKLKLFICVLLILLLWKFAFD